MGIVWSRLRFVNSWKKQILVHIVILPPENAFDFNWSSSRCSRGCQTADSVIDTILFGQANWMMELRHNCTNSLLSMGGPCFNNPHSSFHRYWGVSRRWRYAALIRICPVEHSEHHMNLLRVWPRYYKGNSFSVASGNRSELVAVASCPTSAVWGFHQRIAYTHATSTVTQLKKAMKAHIVNQFQGKKFFDDISATKKRGYVKCVKKMATTEYTPR